MTHQCKLVQLSKPLIAVHFVNKLIIRGIWNCQLSTKLKLWSTFFCINQNICFTFTEMKPRSSVNELIQFLIFVDLQSPLVTLFKPIACVRSSQNSWRLRLLRHYWTTPIKVKKSGCCAHLDFVMQKTRLETGCGKLTLMMKYFCCKNIEILERNFANGSKICDRS